MNKKYYASIDVLRVLLMVFMIIGSYPLPGLTGSYIVPLCSFAAGTFFTLYGYFVLHEVEDISARIKRSIKRVFIAFAIAAVVYFALILVEQLLFGGFESISAFFASYFTPRIIFNFVVLNYWTPNIGCNIWFLQAALYALIIFYFLDKWKLLKYDLQIMIILFLIAIIFGEGAHLIHFNILDYQYIPGNFLTRAMPYMLLGRILHGYRRNRTFNSLRTWIWGVIFALGLMLAFIEMVALDTTYNLIYPNHMVGFILMAAAATMISLRITRTIPGEAYARDIYHVMFFVFTPIGEIITVLINFCANTERCTLENAVRMLLLSGIFTLVISLIISVFFVFVKSRYTITKELMSDDEDKI